MSGAPAAHILATRIKDEAHRLGFDLVGITDVRASDHAEFYRAWLAAGHHGEMSYLARADAVARRTEPQQCWPALRSAIVVALNYYTPAEPNSSSDAAAHGIIARYARGRDYHRVIKHKLLALLDWLERETGRELAAARAYVDTGPVLERELAQRAGLGWFGRNTMLIDPKRGSYFFLATLLLELELPADEPFHADHCGTCNACVSACPTGALLGRDPTGAPVMDATRCISYLTIEQRGPIPRELRPLMGNRIFGCDICQEVCPWNGPKFVQIAREPDFAARAGISAPSLVELMGMTREEWDAGTRGSAIRRSGFAGFKRNVAVAIGNWLAGVAAPPEEAVRVLEAALHDEEPLVRAHAAWALGVIASPAALAALTTRAGVESDPLVLDELSLMRADYNASTR